MPYAFAHPAAVVPIAKLLGHRAVPSALAIGSMIPDAWYFVPWLDRKHSHDLLGALLFCLPAALIAYAAFHLIFKEPILALLPRSVAARLAVWSRPGLPAVPWRWVLLSLLAGVATHLAWDGFTHAGHLSIGEAYVLPGVPVYRALQHASTLIGTAFMTWWIWRKLRQARPCGNVPALEPRLRIPAVAAMLLLPAASFFMVLEAFDGGALRMALRAGGVTALSILGVLLLLFCMAWKRWRPQPVSERADP
jgi:hypothetical protein